jgi:hypothetical protein
MANALRFWEHKPYSGVEDFPINPYVGVMFSSHFVQNLAALIVGEPLMVFFNVGDMPFDTD